MKARELALLLLRSPEAEVILSSDEEGNSFGGLGTTEISYGSWPENVKFYKDVKGVVLYPMSSEFDVPSAIKDSIAWAKRQAEKMTAVPVASAKHP
jgi:hypothetical protein